jgi:hypothetical protein
MANKARAVALAAVVLIQFCIVIMAMMHTTTAMQGGGDATGWLRLIRRGRLTRPGDGNSGDWQSGVHP